VGGLPATFNSDSTVVSGFGFAIGIPLQCAVPSGGEELANHITGDLL